MNDGVSDTLAFSRVLWIHPFPLVFYFSSQSCFPCYKNSKIDKSGVILCKQESLEPWWLRCLPLQPTAASLLFSYCHSYNHPSILFAELIILPKVPRLYFPALLFSHLVIPWIYRMLYNLQKAFMFIIALKPHNNLEK